MKLSFFLDLNRILESARPFHKIVLGLTFISTLSLSAVINQIFEPVKHVYFSFLLTFPLTLGLIIIFLIIINTNWAKVNFIQILVAPMLISLLFVGLNAVSKKYRLEEIGSGFETSQEKSNAHKQQSATSPGYSSSKDATVPNNLQDRMKEVSNGFQNSTESKPEQNHNFFVRWILLIMAGIVSLVNVFKEFYSFYKPLHFYSGIFMAIAFTYYIQKNIIRRFLTIKEKKQETLV